MTRTRTKTLSSFYHRGSGFHSHETGSYNWNNGEVAFSDITKRKSVVVRRAEEKQLRKSVSMIGMKDGSQALCRRHG